MPTSNYRAHIICPDDKGKVEGAPLWKLSGFPFRLVGKTCKVCGKPIAEHGLKIEEGK
jgi:hypothetical protein